MPRGFPLKGSTALVTGASAGIGRAFAGRLAREGADVVLVARNRSRLDELAQELERAHGVRAEVVAADLAQPSSWRFVADAILERGLAIDVLVNNAGFGTHGPFDLLDAGRDQAEIMVNVGSVVALTHAFLPGMLRRRRGAIINVASIAAFQPLPYMAVYGASKAFVVSFSEALRQETRGRGVTIVGLCPGPTDTEFFDHVGDEASLGRRLASPDAVVEAGLRSRARGGGTAIVGSQNRLLIRGTALLPRSMAARISGRMLKTTVAEHRAEAQADSPTIAAG